MSNQWNKTMKVDPIQGQKGYRKEVKTGTPPYKCKIPSHPENRFPEA